MLSQNGRLAADYIVKWIPIAKNWWYFKLGFTEVYSQVSNKQASIGWDDGLAPNRRQPVIWINDTLIYWRIYNTFWCALRNA